MSGRSSPKLRQELMRRLLSSPHFAQAESLRRILLYLSERLEAGDDTPVKEYEIAVSVLGRPSSFDPKIDPIVRVSMAGIRDRLRAYFENEGRNEPLRLALPKGQYRLVFARSDQPKLAEATRNPAVSWFWSPYLLPANPNILVYTELLFFRDPDGNFVRNIYVNDLTIGEAELREKLGSLATGPLSPSFHFVSAGEMACLLAIRRTFGEMGAALDVRNSRFFSWVDARRANLVLLGSSRTNPFVRSLHSGLPFVITERSIENREPKPNEQASYTGSRSVEGRLERVIEYAVITRRPGPAGGSVVTMISANHGRAIEGAGSFVTDEAHLLGLMEAIGNQRFFQLLLRVQLLDFDEEVVDVEYVAHRVL